MLTTGDDGDHHDDNEDDGEVEALMVTVVVTMAVTAEVPSFVEPSKMFWPSPRARAMA